MRFTILGSGTCVPSPRRSSAAYHVELGEQTCMVDGGSGSLHQLAKAGKDYKELDAIFYTHFHIDHSGDLLPLLHAFKNDPLLRREKPFTMYGPIGLKKLVEHLTIPFGDLLSLKNFEIILHELDDYDEVQLIHGKVIARRVPHTDNSLGYRFVSDQNKTLVFSGDTGEGDVVVELAQDADVAVFECSCPEEYFTTLNVQGHLTATLAGKMAQRAGVKHLILSHIYPPTDDFPLEERCKKVFEGKITRAEDLLTFEI